MTIPGGNPGTVFEDEHARIEIQEAVWDAPHFGAPVFQIDRIVAKSDLASTGTVARLLDACRAQRAALVSCRLGTECVAEGMLLEQHGFRHIEVVLYPEMGLPHRFDAQPESPCGSRLAAVEDLPHLESIARTAFVNERFHIDPRIDRSVAAARYIAWMTSALTHALQRLHALVHSGSVVGFFVTEHRPDGVCYWHLNAVSPAWQGRGIGKAGWQKMVEVAQAQGCTAVRSCIAVRNVKAINLYASLGFAFTDPAMTLHWIP